MSNMKELRGVNQFPEAVARVPEAEPVRSEKPYYSAVPMSISTGNGRFVFGMNREATAAILRALADDIENSRVVLMQGAVTSKVRGDEFAQTWLTIKFSEPVSSVPTADSNGNCCR